MNYLVSLISPSPIRERLGFFPGEGEEAALCKYMQINANEGTGGWSGKLLSQGTCAHDSSEDPALAIFDWLEPALEPLVQNGHAATPVQWAGTAAVLALPLALNHTPVIVAVHLGRGRHRSTTR